MKNRFFVLKQALMFNATSIFAPIAFFGGIGFLADTFFQTGNIFLFSSLAVSFVVTHILLYRKLMVYSCTMQQTIDDEEGNIHKQA